MCGIGGIVGGGPPQPAVLARMAEAMAHRGPDGQAVWHDEHAGLAFRRLAIIDLDDRSMQPLHLGSLHLVFNGEIYDYRERRDELIALGHAFATEGDGEVLLHAWQEWGAGALDRLDGMFAFAVYDDATRELVLAADRFGEKPLYYTQDGERLVFGSDLRALWAALDSVPAPDPGALAPFVGRGLMPPIDRSFFSGVDRLPGAHVLRFAAGRVRMERYWTPQTVAVPGRYEDAVDQLRELLLASITRRLRSDVPVGTSLSGGVDSSAVVALAAQLAGEHSRHAFTARFPGFARDEWSYAEAAARVGGVVSHHAVEPTADTLADDIDALVAAQEEPFGSLSIYAQYAVMRTAHEAGVTVLLDGQGADELFGGYPGANGWALRSAGARATARGLLTDRGDVLNALGSEWLQGPIARRHRRTQVTPYASAETVAAAAGVEPPASTAATPLRRELLRQAFHTSLPQLLRYADRNSMAHSREVRLPYLERGVAEFALSLPPEFVYRDGVTKAVLRDAVRGLVPDVILDRRDKVGFEAPQETWLATPAWRERIAAALLDPGAATRDLVDRNVVEADVAAGRWRDAAGIWRAYNVELWQRAGRPAEAVTR